MSHQSAQHDHLLLNSVPQTPQQHHPPNLTAPIKSENDSDDDVVSFPTVPKILHSPDEYDSECQCNTCKLATKLLAECTCEQCRGTGQPGQSSGNVPIANAVSPTNGQPSSSSIQNNDASTSEHTNANDRDDDHSRSSTPNYLPRFFDDESGDSSSDDSENGNSVYSGVDQKSESDDNDSSDNESANSDDERKVPTSVNCPKCSKAFTEKYKLIRHYRYVHQEWKPYYCRWPKCNFTSAIVDAVAVHAYRKHFKSKNRHKARKYVGKLEETPPNDPVLEQIISIKFVRKKKKRDVTRCICPRCGRNLSFNQLQSHNRTHANPGYRCTWPNCGFFYSQLHDAKKHVCTDHLQVEQANSQQTTQYLVKVIPKTNKTTKVTCQLRSQREEDHHDNDGGEEDSNLDNDDADNSSIKPTSTFNSNCPKCDRNFRAKGQFTQHFRTHANIGFLCAKCGAFYSQFPFAKKHLLMEHFKGKLVNATQINELIIRVDPNMPKSNELHDSIQNNDTSTSDHTNANDDRSRSSTPDYLPRFFDDESGDSSSDDDGDDHDSVAGGDKMELVQESEREKDNDNSDPDYTFNDSSSDDSENDDSVGDGDDSFDNMEIDEESECHNSNVHSQPSTSCQNAIITNVDKSNLIDNESTNSVDKVCTDLTPDKCPKCDKTFPEMHKLHRPYQGVHQEWKPYYCRWPKGNFASAVDNIVVTHADNEYFNSQNRQIAKRFVGKREEAPSKNPALEQIDGIKFRKNGFGQTRSSCPRCGRNFYSEHLKSHIRTHANPSFRCIWPKCGFFYSYLPSAKKHVCTDHLQVEQANSQQTNRYLVKVNAKTGETTKVRTRIRKEEDYTDNSEDEEDSDSDDDSDENGDHGDYKELAQESEEDNDNCDPDYAFRDSSLDDDVADGDRNMEIDNESLNSIVYSQPSTSFQNSPTINDNCRSVRQQRRLYHRFWLFLPELSCQND